MVIHVKCFEKYLGLYMVSIIGMLPIIIINYLKSKKKKKKKYVVLVNFFSKAILIKI